MIILTAFFVIAWIATNVLEAHGYFLDNPSGSRQAQSRNSHEFQSIAIPVKDGDRFSRN